MSKVYIINPTGTAHKKKRTSSSSTNGGAMRRKKRTRSKASYRTAGLKAARTRKRGRRKNPTRHRLVVYSTGRGRSKRLRRSKMYRLKPRRVNPRRRRSTRARAKGIVGKYLGRNRMQNALLVLLGLGGSAVLKGFVTNFVPAGATRDWAQRLYGLASIALGVTVQMQGRRKAVKSAGVGLVIFGVYDLIVSNTPLGVYLPTIGAPSAFLPAETQAGYYGNFGQRTYNDQMGSNIGSPGGIEVVGSNIGPSTPEVVGDDYDLADMLEMAT